MKVSVIDLGFNSLKLVTYEVRPDKSFYVAEQRSVAARLGEGLEEHGYLKPEPIRRTVEALETFREVTDAEPIKHVLPIATSAVREAKNKEQFVQQVFKETGFAFKILSEREEAFYSYAGAFLSVSEPDVLFFDLGGGSLEMVRRSNSSIRKSFSLPLGALRLTRMYANKRGTFSKKNYSRMRRHIYDLVPDPGQLNLKRKTVLVGVGGSVRALASYDQEINDYPLYKVHRYTLSREAVDSILTNLVSSKVTDIAKLDCIGSERAQTITAGVTVIDSTMEKLSFDELTISTQGLRDGILVAYLQNPKKYQMGKPVDPTNLIKQHPLHPFEYSREFVWQLLRNNLITQKEVNILSTGASHFLRGLPSYRPYALFYVLMDEDANMNHESQMIMALSIVRTMKAKPSDWLYQRYKSILSPSGKDSIRRITTLLKFVILIEKSHCRINGRRLDGTILFQILPEKNVKNRHFPAELLRLASADVCDMFDVSIKLPDAILGGSKEATIPVEEIQ